MGSCQDSEKVLIADASSYVKRGLGGSIARVIQSLNYKLAVCQKLLNEYRHACKGSGIPPGIFETYRIQQLGRQSKLLVFSDQDLPQTVSRNQPDWHLVELAKLSRAFLVISDDVDARAKLEQHGIRAISGMDFLRGFGKLRPDN